MSASACLWEIGKVALAPGRRMRGYGRGMSGRDEWEELQDPLLLASSNSRDVTLISFLPLFELTRRLHCVQIRVLYPKRVV